ncbi:MAG: hypothetical protein JO019_02335 [Candidatus Kaiserbacteria bacterium]|nr:hypothetical protein [Candidatus Kaiserbacteria bacterium]
MADDKDWRASVHATKTADEIIALVDDLCERALRPPHILKKTQTVAIVAGAFLSAFDAAVKSGLPTRAEVDEGNLIGAFMQLLREGVDIFVAETGAEESEVLSWMRNQFAQAFDRRITAAMSSD